MEIPEHIKKALQDAQEFANSPEYRRAVKESIELMSLNKIDIDLIAKLARENSKYLDYNTRNTIESIEYIKKGIPDLEIIKNDWGASASSVIQNINIPLENINSVVAINEISENISINDSVEYFDFLTNYPMLGYMHDVGQKIFNYINQCEKQSIINKKLFRIRGYSAKRKSPYSILELIGPPFGVSQQNRFNNIGAKVSYFSDDAEVLKKEINLKNDDKYSQIEINLTKECLMLDVRDMNIPIFKLCHNKVERKNDYFNIEYVLPNYISDCARKAGFDGIIYRSTIEINATNYAFFYLAENDIQKINRIDNLPD